MSEYHLITPNLPGAEEKARLITGLLQRNLSAVEPADFDHTFFTVLAHYENQARKAGMSDSQNPFIVLGNEIQQFLFQNAEKCLTATDAPLEFSNEFGRFRHMMKESADQAGLVPLAIRAAKELLPKLEAPQYEKFRAQVLTELGGAYLELQIEARAKAVQTGIDYLQQGLALRPAVVDPLTHAETQYQLGTAYLQLPQPLGQRRPTLEKAAQAFETARQVAIAAQVEVNQSLCEVGLGTALALFTSAESVDFQRGIALLKRANAYFQAQSFAREQTLVNLRLAALYLSASPAQPLLALEQLDKAGASGNLSAPARLALQLQQAFALLQLEGDEALIAAGEFISATLPWWSETRNAQQNMQVSTACGPAFSHLLAPNAWLRLQAEISRLEMDSSPIVQRALARVYLQALIAAPARGDQFALRVLDAIRMACSTCLK